LLAGFATQGTGRYEQSIEETRKALRLDPDFRPGYSNLAFGYLHLDRLEEAEHALQEASERKIDIPDLMLLRFHLSFLKGDKTGMDRDAALTRGKPGAEDLMSHSEALGRAFALSGDKTKAKTAYQDFLTLWKDADPDIPILKQAQAEYTKLQ